MAKKTSIKFPGGYQGIALTSTNESVQEELFLPADGRLIAVNQPKNDPDFGTLVCDLKEQEIDPDRMARLQSILRVIKYPLGQSNNSIGLQIGPSGLLDCQAFIVDRGAGGKASIAQASEFEGGPFHCGTGGCIHKHGLDDDGNPISALHFVTNALFWKDDVQDGPLRFEDEYNQGYDGPYYTPVHLGWAGLDWAWWTTSHWQLEREEHDTGKIKRQPPPMRVVPWGGGGGKKPLPLTPTPGGHLIGGFGGGGGVGGGGGPGPGPPPPPPGGQPPPMDVSQGTNQLPGEVAPVRTDGGRTPQQEQEDNLRNLRRISGVGDPAPLIPPVSFNAPTQAGQTGIPHLSSMVSTATPGTLARPASSDRRKLATSNYPNINQRQASQFDATPVAGQMAAFGAQGGVVGGGAPSYTSPQVGATGDPWAYTHKPGEGKYKEGTASGGWVLLPPEVNLVDTENGFMPDGIDLSTTYFLVGPGAWFGAGQPEFSDGGIQDGYSWGQDTATGDLIFRAHVNSAAPVTAFKLDLATQNFAWKSGTAYYGIFEHANTGERTYTFPDASGIVALTASVVTSIIGTANQVLANGTSGSGQVGAVTLTLPQDIATTSTPQFARLGVGVAADGTASLKLNTVADLAGNFLTVASGVVNYRTASETLGDIGAAASGHSHTHTADILGTSNQVSVANGADVLWGSTDVTLSLPQDIHTGASPTFANLTDSGITATHVVYGGTAGLLTGSANMTFSGTNLLITGTEQVTQYVNVGTVTDAAGQGDIAAGLTGAARIWYDQSAGLLAGYRSDNSAIWSIDTENYLATLGTNTVTAMGDGGTFTKYQLGGTGRYGLMAINNSLTAVGTTLGAIAFGCTGTSNAEKRGALIASTVVVDSATAMNANMVFYTISNSVPSANMTLARRGTLQLESGMFRSKGGVIDATESGGPAIEMAYSTSLSRGLIVSYDRTLNQYKKTVIDGLTLELHVSSAPYFYLATTGNVGVRTAHPDRAFDALDGTNPQFRITRTDGTVFADFETSATIALKITGVSYKYLEVDETLFNTSLGYAALQSNTTGYSSSAMGYCALSSNTTGHSNSAMGIQALRSNTTGTHNSAMGYYALRNNTEGTYNSAMGLNALRSNTTGNYNSAMGMQALFSNSTGHSNSAMGEQALYSNTTGYSNSAMGLNALYDVTDGIYNTGVGFNTGCGITTGDYNTILGAQVTGLAADLQNTVILADGAGNQRLVIDSAAAAVFSGTGRFLRLGIGAAADATAKLYVKGVSQYTDYLQLIPTSGAGTIYIQSALTSDDVRINFRIGANTGWSLGRDATDGVIANSFKLNYGNETTFGSPAITVLVTGAVGINTPHPDRAFDALDGTGAPQIRATYTDGTYYTDFETKSNGNFLVTLTSPLFTITGNAATTLKLESTSGDAGENAFYANNLSAHASSRAAIEFKTGISAEIWQWFARNGSFWCGAAGVADYLQVSRGSWIWTTNGSGTFTWNEGGVDSDFRIEGDTLPYAFWLDASAATENIALLTTAAPNWQTMDRGLYHGESETAPTGNPSAGYFQYGADWNGAGTCVPFFRGEDGSIVKLYTGTHIADAAGGATVDAEARTAIAAINARLEALGFNATS